MRAGGEKQARIIAKMREVDSTMHNVTVQCRQDTLDRRDRLLRSLSPEAQLALEAFVEEHKAGIEVSVPKNGIQRYMEPK
jgi:hypothetical protein